MALVRFGHAELRAYPDLGRARSYSCKISHEDNIPISSLTLNSLGRRKTTKLLYAAFFTVVLFVVFPEHGVWGSHASGYQEA